MERLYPFFFLKSEGRNLTPYSRPALSPISLSFAAFFNGLMIKARGTTFLSDGVTEGGELAQYLTQDEKMERSSDPMNGVDPDDGQVLMYARQMLEFGNQRMESGLMYLNQIDFIKKSYNYQDGKK